MSVKVKICGIRNFNAAIAAVDAGVHFLGFNFVPTSKRHISPSDAAKIISAIKGKVKIVGVFQNAPVADVNNISLSLGLDFVQLHGCEDNKYISQINTPVIKTIHIDSKPDNIKADYFLLDRPNRKSRMVNLKKATQLAQKLPLFFAGGLNLENVENIIQQVRPFAVDVASGVETNGLQDIQKIKKFIKKAKESL